MVSVDESLPPQAASKVRLTSAAASARWWVRMKCLSVEGVNSSVSRRGTSKDKHTPDYFRRELSIDTETVFVLVSHCGVVHR